jgi:hypothetical protein
MLYITWTTDKLGHPHARWNQVKQSRHDLMILDKHELICQTTPRTLTGKGSSRRVSVQPLRYSRGEKHSNN